MYIIWHKNITWTQEDYGKIVLNINFSHFFNLQQKKICEIHL